MSRGGRRPGAGRKPLPDGTLRLWSDGNVYEKAQGNWVRAAGDRLTLGLSDKSNEAAQEIKADLGAARQNDRDTSIAAAQAQRGGARVAIIEAFEAHGDLTDDELASLLEPAFYPPTTKSARSRLTNEGVLVDSTYDKRESKRGQPQTVWVLAAQYRPIEEVRDDKERVA